MYYCYLDTPIGELLLAGEDDALSMIGFPKGSMRRDPEPDWIYNEKPLAKAREQNLMNLGEQEAKQIISAYGFKVPKSVLPSLPKKLLLPLKNPLKLPKRVLMEITGI